MRILNNLITELNKTLSQKKPWSIPDECEQIDIMGNLLLDYNICMCMMLAIIPSKVIELSEYFDWNEAKLTLREYDIKLKIEPDTGKIKAFTMINV